MSGHIMIVEDERIVALDLKSTLESLGHEVVGIASRGDVAIHEAGRLRPDLVLMDIHLEGAMDGTEAACRIREQHHVPVLFLTAYAEAGTLDRAEASLPYGYLVKPIETRELEATLRMALARRRAERELEKGEERLRLAVDAATLGVWEWERASDRFTAGGHLDDILGATPASMRYGPDPFLDRICDADRAEIDDALADGRPISTTVRYRRASGDVGWLDLHAKAHPGSEGGTERFVGVIRDVTERRENEEKLRQAGVVFRTAAEGILILDAQRRIISANPAFCLLTGYTAEDVPGLDPDDFLHACPRGNGFYALLGEDPKGYRTDEVNCRRKDGELFPAWQHICAVRDDSGTLTHYVIALSDISAIRSAEAQIHHLAFHDALTGLGNRHLLEEHLETELERARRTGQRVALLFIDLDGFKLVNDSLGHAAGDQLLRVVAGRIRSAIRRADMAIRVGGDEFVVIVPHVQHTEDCIALADKLLREIRTTVELQEDRVTISGSVGIALFPDNAADRYGLLKAADSAMYGAKSRGRNRHAFYSEDMAEQARERMNVEQGMLRALESDALVLHYQPVIALASQHLVGFEALVRWQHPERGLVPPACFIPVAEESGLIEEVGLWVLRTACLQLVRWQTPGAPPLRLAVNVSARQMLSAHFADQLRTILADTGLPPQQLELEITESTIQTLDHSRELLSRVKTLGVSVAIDDFGTGFSSLSLLKHLPIDRVKIDKSFVRDLPADTNDAEITRAIAALVRTLKLKLIAEGVETRAQLDFLRGLGCDEVQGALFAMPLSTDDVEQLLEERAVRL